MDTLPAALQSNQTNDWITAVASAMTLLLNPALIAIVLNIGLVQAVEAFDHLPIFKWFWMRDTQDVNRARGFVIAWALTLPFMGVTCWLMGLPFRGVNAGFAILSGPVAFVISELILKKLGLDLSKWFGQDEPPAVKP